MFAAFRFSVVLCFFFGLCQVLCVAVLVSVGLLFTPGGAQVSPKRGTRLKILGARNLTVKQVP